MTFDRIRCNADYSVRNRGIADGKLFTPALLSTGGRGADRAGSLAVALTALTVPHSSATVQTPVSDNSFFFFSLSKAQTGLKMLNGLGAAFHPLIIDKFHTFTNGSMV